MPAGPAHGKGCDCPRCEHRRQYQRFYRAGQRVRPAPAAPAITAPPVRTYGEPWDSRIAAGAYYSQPPSGQPRSNDRFLERKEDEG
jgi:hypothetical protein